MKRQTTRLGPIRAAALLTLALTGCHSAMSTSAPQDASVPPSSDGNYTNTVADWPLRFSAHYFAAFCYSTYSCMVRYGHYYPGEPSDDVLQVSSASLGSRYPENMTAGWGPIPNFPPPAIVTWRSKDGTSHRAEIDMAEIFKDQLIRHNLAREEIPETASINPPDIILEINDRTINVYMRAHISTKELQKPGNKYSDFRNDLIKVFSRTD